MFKVEHLCLSLIRSHVLHKIHTVKNFLSGLQAVRQSVTVFRKVVSRQVCWNRLHQIWGSVLVSAYYWLVPSVTDLTESPPLSDPRCYKLTGQSLLLYLGVSVYTGHSATCCHYYTLLPRRPETSANWFRQRKSPLQLFLDRNDLEINMEYCITMIWAQCFQYFTAMRLIILTETDVQILVERN